MLVVDGREDPGRSVLSVLLFDADLWFNNLLNQFSALGRLCLR